MVFFACSQSWNPPLPPQNPRPPAGKNLRLAPGNVSFSLATYNLGNLFDTEDDPLTEDTVLDGSAYQRKLQKLAQVLHEDLAEPAILAVQEAEGVGVLQDLANRPEVESDYTVVVSDSIDQRGLDVGLMYRSSQVKLLEYTSYQGCTSLIDGLDADGNGDVKSPENAITCDANHDGALDGNRLFSRPPLAAHFRVCKEDCATENASAPEIWLIVNHLKSKVEDTDETQYTLPRRIEQAKFIAQLAQQLKTRSPDALIIILGDMNDYPASQPLQELTGQGYSDLILQVEKPSAYSYNFQGVSQILDHILIFPTPGVVASPVTVHHVNADYPADLSGNNQTKFRGSDHDPVSVTFTFSEEITFLPAISYP